MKRRGHAWLLLAASFLAACAPTVSTAPAVAGEATFTRSHGQTFDTLTFDPGQAPALHAAAFLSGDVIRVNDARCSIVSTSLRCLLGDVQPGKPKLIFATGVTVARVEYGTGDSKTHVVALK